MRLIACLIASMIVGCAGNNGSVEHKEPADSGVLPPDANSDDGGATGSDVPFIPPNADTGGDAGCFYGQYLYCADSTGITIPSCGVVCNVETNGHPSILGPVCFTCATPNDVANCGWICEYPDDAGAQDAGAQ
jgi:hypothetical protein